ncbi:hypothetical protein N7492_000940 [Penicillium capsulatum]|uniref:Uncharacterized protein n=1 Tax=Penicillium capsulatum TaxID=69766 RepID=A0A9W9LZW0_9EURO|nr:hypothetical protein N7492_000940 [Penicillium capsulatum]KAJ6130003.1 hypothetical protein N7512_002783 [Penicillium capsulatum]
MRLTIRAVATPGPLAPLPPPPLPPVRIPVCTLYQGAEIKWVNVCFLRRDERMSDLELLRCIEARFDEAIRTQEETMVTASAVSALKPYCVSIQVVGTFYTLDDILKDAKVTVQRWRRELPIRGLPFRRGDVFNERGSGSNLDVESLWC